MDICNGLGEIMQMRVRLEAAFGQSGKGLECLMRAVNDYSHPGWL